MLFLPSLPSTLGNHIAETVLNRAWQLIQNPDARLDEDCAGVDGLMLDVSLQPSQSGSIFVCRVVGIPSQSATEDAEAIDILINVTSVELGEKRPPEDADIVGWLYRNGAQERLLDLMNN